MIGGYVRADPTEAPSVIRTKFLATGLRVNPDTNAYAENLQIIVKPPWTDDVASGGKPYVLQKI
ncbi:hypothetical protein ACTXT7_014340 [Hymenolepis weldensis]